MARTHRKVLEKNMGRYMKGKQGQWILTSDSVYSYVAPRHFRKMLNKRRRLQDKSAIRRDQDSERRVNDAAWYYF